MSASRSELRTIGAVALLIVAMASIQSGAAIAKSLFPVVGPVGTATLRLIFAAILLVVVFRAWNLRVARGQLRMVLIYGIALGGMNTLFYMALDRIPLGIATALEFTGPLAVALISSRRLLDLLWIALAAAGLVLLLPLGGTSAELDIIGCLLALAAGVCWALYIVFGRKAGMEHGIGTTALGMIVAGIIVLPIGARDAIPALASPAVLGLAITVAILSSALPYSLEMVALRRLHPRTFGTLMSLEPAFAALSGIVILGEWLDAAQFAGIFGVVLASLGAIMTAHGEGESRVQGDPMAGDIGE